MGYLWHRSCHLLCFSGLLITAFLQLFCLIWQTYLHKKVILLNTNLRQTLTFGCSQVPQCPCWDWFGTKQDTGERMQLHAVDYHVCFVFANGLPKSRWGVARSALNQCESILGWWHGNDFPILQCNYKKAYYSLMKKNQIYAPTRHSVAIVWPACSFCTVIWPWSMVFYKDRSNWNIS